MSPVFLFCDLFTTPEAATKKRCPFVVPRWMTYVVFIFFFWLVVYCSGGSVPRGRWARRISTARGIPINDLRIICTGGVGGFPFRYSRAASIPAVRLVVVVCFIFYKWHLPYPFWGFDACPASHQWLVCKLPLASCHASQASISAVMASAMASSMPAVRSPR